MNVISHLLNTQNRLMIEIEKLEMEYHDSDLSPGERCFVGSEIADMYRIYHRVHIELHEYMLSARSNVSPFQIDGQT